MKINQTWKKLERLNSKKARKEKQIKLSYMFYDYLFIINNKKFCHQNYY